MIIDLSVRLNAKTPVYPGDPETKIEPAGVLEKDGWCDYYISMGTHVGTHIDAPAHMLDAETLDKFPLEQFIGTGKYVRVDGEFDLEAIKRANLQKGDIVLFHTGMVEHYHEPVYFEKYPAMSEEVARYLVERKLKMVGVDAGSVDNQDGFPIHKILLAGGVLIIENLTNLEQLAGKSFKIYALPLNLDIEASPARVIAEV
jgi:kynurenine formamidase